jgi:hypothetical protein
MVQFESCALPNLMPSATVPETTLKDLVDPLDPAVVVSRVGEPRIADGRILRSLPEESYQVLDGAL